MDARFAVSQPLPASQEAAFDAVVFRATYRADVDGLRAIAALAVIGIHTGLVRGGFVGVDIFFVISGYLISGIILRSLGARTFSFIDFYARRIRRIFPALALVLISVLLFGALLLLNEEYRLLGKDVTAGAAFLMNFTLWLHPDPNVNLPRMLAHLWSLSVEEQFYVVWPLFLWGIWRWVRKRFIEIVLLVTVVSFCADVALASHRPMTAYALPWTRVWQLSLGCALAYSEMIRTSSPAAAVVSSCGGRLSRLRVPGFNARALLGSALLIFSFACFTTVQIESLPAVWKLAPTIGACLLISAGPQGWVNRHVLSAAPIVFIGLISYPLYLWHLPLLLALPMYQHNVTPTMTAAAIVATVLLSIGTYRYVETPLRSAKHGALKASCLIAVMAMCALGGCLAFLGLMPARRPPEEISSIIAATNEDVWSASRRSSWSQSPDGVLFRGDSPAFVLYVGDSNMAQYYPRVDKLLTDHPASSRSAIFAARDACVPGAVERFDSAQADRGPCREFLRSVAQHAASPQVEVVVIGASWYRYFRRYAGDRGPLRPQTKLLLHDLRQTLEGLVKAGKRVYLILNIPVNSKFDPHRMIQRTLKSPGFVSVIEMPTRADVVDDIDPVSAQLVHLAKTAGAIIIDPAQSFCDSQRCRVIAEDGRPIYRDLWHLRPSYVREYADFLDVTLLGESGNADPR